MLQSSRSLSYQGIWKAFLKSREWSVSFEKNDLRGYENHQRIWLGSGFPKWNSMEKTSWFIKHRVSGPGSDDFWGVGSPFGLYVRFLSSHGSFSILSSMGYAIEIEYVEHRALSESGGKPKFSLEVHISGMAGTWIMYNWKAQRRAKTRDRRCRVLSAKPARLTQERAQCNGTLQPLRRFGREQPSFSATEENSAWSSCNRRIWRWQVSVPAHFFGKLIFLKLILFDH